MLYVEWMIFHGAQKAYRVEAVNLKISPMFGAKLK
jgi:hypothetical protein